MKAKSALLATIASVGIACSAQARPQVYVDMTGWEVWSRFDLPGENQNTGIILKGIGEGSSIDQIEFTNIVIESFGISYNNQFVASVNSWDGGTYTNYWDSKIAGTAFQTGQFGPASVPFNNPGWYGSGPFVLNQGENDLYVTVYDSLDVGGPLEQDHRVISGGITITYTQVPAPGALSLLGLTAAFGKRRRRT